MQELTAGDRPWLETKPILIGDFIHKAKTGKLSPGSRTHLAKRRLLGLAKEEWRCFFGPSFGPKARSLSL
ncbi:hypothetical protein AYI73_14490 [Shewanella algae]|nr:hypothetical protein AYI73_14490 [Shewanella algae]